ncbi:hypothetical protein EZJ17_04105 [Eikenella exigua]|uniref:Uncharacterized protein n=1 Tax=Eikenella exigua TaxID=2528037 RepID=A0AAX1F771_9NEIS|nr:hypothetical protein EZJ17_04105 [Eikenella exigua]
MRFRAAASQIIWLYWAQIIWKYFQAFEKRTERKYAENGILQRSQATLKFSGGLLCLGLLHPNKLLLLLPFR